MESVWVCDSDRVEDTARGSIVRERYLWAGARAGAVRVVVVRAWSDISDSEAESDAEQHEL